MKMSNIEGLKPCPFCGGKAQLVISDDKEIYVTRNMRKNLGLDFHLKYDMPMKKI